jgi:SAM-dependent methyltransferase
VITVFPARAFLASCLALCLASCLAFPAGALAQAPGPAGPVPGDIGKDVMWIPSDDVMVTRMLDAGGVTARDYVIDLGSGDGRIVIGAARRGARALGVEYNPDLVEMSVSRAARAGVSGRARFVQGDLFRADLAPASVITLFLEEDNNLKLRPKLLGLKPGTRIVSNYFGMGDWRPDRELAASVQEGCTAYCVAYLWIVPAQAGGGWKLGDGELTLKQSYQMIAGTLRAGGGETVLKGRLNGDQIAFSAGDTQYTGRVRGNSIKGTVKTGSGASGWSATRARP